MKLTHYKFFKTLWGNSFVLHLYGAWYYRDPQAHYTNIVARVVAPLITFFPILKSECNRLSFHLYGQMYAWQKKPHVYQQIKTSYCLRCGWRLCYFWFLLVVKPELDKREVGCFNSDNNQYKDVKWKKRNFQEKKERGRGEKVEWEKSKRVKELQMFSKCRKQSQPNNIFNKNFYLKLFSDSLNQ